MQTVPHDEVDEALRRVDELIDRIDDEAIDTISEESDHGHPVKGRIVQHGDLRYNVICSPQIPYLRLESGFNVVEGYAHDLARSRADGQDDPIQIDASELEGIQDQLVEEVEDEDPEELYQDLVERITVDEIAIGSIQRTDGGYPVGLTVRTRLYCYDDDLTVTEFYESVQTLMNVAFAGRELLVGEFDLREGPDSDGGAAEADIGFQ